MLGFGCCYWWLEGTAVLHSLLHFLSALGRPGKSARKLWSHVSTITKCPYSFHTKILYSNERYSLAAAIDRLSWIKCMWNTSYAPLKQYKFMGHSEKHPGILVILHKYQHFCIIINISRFSDATRPKNNSKTFSMGFKIPVLIYFLRISFVFWSIGDRIFKNLWIFDIGYTC